MINHINGRLVEKNPAHVVIEANGVGYFLNISLNTYSKLGSSEACKLLTHLSIKEDAHSLYGFINEEEREIFRKLISVSGVGASTARVMLSSLSPSEVAVAISTANVAVLKGVKGIGGKTAERIIIDLKDKVLGSDSVESIAVAVQSTDHQEALGALMALGFNKGPVEKVLQKLVSKQPDLNVEGLIKEALKLL